MQHGEAELESALRQVDRAIYESENKRQARPTSNPEVEDFCNLTKQILKRTAPILRGGGEPARKTMFGMTTFFYGNLEKWASQIPSLSPTDRAKLHRCLKDFLSVIEPDPPRLKW